MLTFTISDPRPNNQIWSSFCKSFFHVSFTHCKARGKCYEKPKCKGTTWQQEQEEHYTYKRLLTSTIFFLIVSRHKRPLVQEEILIFPFIVWHVCSTIACSSSSFVLSLFHSLFPISWWCKLFHNCLLQAFFQQVLIRENFFFNITCLLHVNNLVNWK